MNQLKAGAALNYVIIGLNTIVGLAYTPYMLRCLGQSEYGLYSLVSSVIAYLTVLDFGFGNAIVRYTSRFRAEGRSGEQWEMFGMFLIVYTVIGLLAFSGGLCLYFNVDWLFDRTMDPGELAQVRVMMLLLTLNLAVTFPLGIFGSIISAYEDFVFQRVVNIVRILLCTAVMAALLSAGYKAVSLVAVNTAFNVLTLLLNLVYCRRKLRIKVRFARFDMVLLKEIATYSFWIFLNAIMDRIYWGTGQFVLGTVSGTVAVAVFSVAITLESMYMQFSTSLVSVLLPRLTSMVTLNRGSREISDLFIRTGRLQCMVMAFILSGFILFGRTFISLWAGEGYRDSYTVTLIFFAALFVPLIQNTGITVLQARNRMKFRSLLYLCISVASLIAQILLARRMGAIGCALSIGGALVLGQGVVMNIYYARKEDIDIQRFWKEILGMLAVPALLTVTGHFALGCLRMDNPAGLATGILVFSIMYIPCMLRFSANRYERNLLLAPLRKVIQRI